MLRDSRNTLFLISFEEVCAAVMGAKQKEQLRRMIGFRIGAWACNAGNCVACLLPSLRGDFQYKIWEQMFGLDMYKSKEVWYTTEQNS